jgi:hypothetical protein
VSVLPSALFDEVIPVAAELMVTSPSAEIEVVVLMPLEEVTTEIVLPSSLVVFSVTVPSTAVVSIVMLSALILIVLPSFRVAVVPPPEASTNMGSVGRLVGTRSVGAAVGVLVFGSFVHDWTLLASFRANPGKHAHSFSATPPTSTMTQRVDSESQPCRPSVHPGALGICVGIIVVVTAKSSAVCFLHLVKDDGSATKPNKQKQVVITLPSSFCMATHSVDSLSQPCIPSSHWGSPEVGAFVGTVGSMVGAAVGELVSV